MAEAPRTHTRYIRGFLVGLWGDDLVRKIPDKATLIGISVVFTHEWPAVAHLTRLIKAARPDLSIVLGGEHVTALPEFCLATSAADYLVLGEGEEIAVDLANALKNGSDITALTGIAYRDGEAIVVNERRGRRLDIDDIPLPAWHLFDVKTYNDHNFVGGMDIASSSMPMLATRGCPYQCTFCAAPNMWTPRWMARDPISVVDELESYMQLYGATDFVFQDLTAITRKDWLVAFCTEILRRGLGITWQLPTGTRSEAIDAEVADLLYRTGMKNMVYAPESGSETTRRLIKKKLNGDSMMESIRATVKAKLNVGVGMIVGLPHDNKDNLAECLPFLRLAAKEGVADVSVGFYMALPGTELFHCLYDAGKVVLDCDYFIHILHATALHPSKTYSGSLGKMALIYWKMRFFYAFYGEGKGLFKSILRGAMGIFSDHPESRLAGAFQNAFFSSFQSLKVQFGKRWITRQQENELFADWDQIYRTIRRQKVAAGTVLKPPAETTDLHKTNVIKVVRHEHSRQHRVVPNESEAVLS